jgi:K+-sensing histidine kinase KdpD
MGNLIEDMLQLAQAQAGRLQIDWKEYAIKDVFDQVEQQVRDVAPDYQTKFKVSAVNDNIFLRCDKDLIVKSLSYFIKFMMRHCPPECEIHLEEQFLEGEGFIRLIAPSWELPEVQLRQLFAQSRANFDYTVAKAIITAHGGRVWAKSDPEGTVISITLPTRSSRPRHIQIAG